MSTALKGKSRKRARDAVTTKGEGHKIIIGIDYGTTFSGMQIDSRYAHF